jgi:uroporphyrinogen-III decarboxylase
MVGAVITYGIQMTAKEIVKRAVEFRNPPRVPLLYFNEYTERSDIKRIPYNQAEDFVHRGTAISEWGFEWVRLDKTMGQPRFSPITDWEKWKNYIPPNPHAKGRFTHVAEFAKKNRDAYLMGCLGISGFNMVTFIRGFEQVMEDLYLERDNLLMLVDTVMNFESEIIRQFSAFHLDAISFEDDWGSQRSLLISPVLWRELFKPRLAKQFELIHKLGMHVYFHCCGYIYDIIADLIEIGVDILNLNQPDLLGIENLSRDFGGKVCFNCPVDHQTVAIFGNDAEIKAYVDRLYRHFGCFGGGYIGYIEEYSSIGMSSANFKSIVDAFETLAAGSGT